TEMVTTYTAPTIRTGSSTYNTNAQNLLATTGSAENGTLSYSYRYKTIGGGYGSWSGWTTTAPTGINAGVYEVKYKVEPATGYTGGVGETSLGEFTINKANPSGSVTVQQATGIPIRYYATYNGTGTITKWEYRSFALAPWKTSYSTSNPSSAEDGDEWRVTVGGTNYNTATFESY
ncbi:MAG: hypothetical protein J6Y15_01920, partial [Bacteroidaceae bacterium]|nr:hypothetical protein [Bacteroidaceae bacterium]